MKKQERRWNLKTSQNYLVDSSILDRLRGLAMLAAEGKIPSSTSLTTGISSELMNIVYEYEDIMKEELK